VACLAGVTGLLLGSTALAGSDSAESSPITVDTRDAGVPSIQLSAFYFTPNSHTYFLRGVSIEETMSVAVEWNGTEEGEVQFLKNGYAVGGTTPTTITFNPGAWDVGTKLAAFAVSADGAKSAVETANFDVIPPPHDLDYTLQISPFRYTADYMRTVFNVSAAFPEEIPVIGGMGVDADFVVLEEMTVRRNGTATSENDDLWKDGTLGFRIDETVISPTYDTRVEMVYDGSNWEVEEGEVEIGLEVAHSLFPDGMEPRWLIFYVDVSLLGSAEGTFLLADYATYANSRFDAGIGLELYAAAGVPYIANIGVYGSAMMVSGWQVPHYPTWYKFGVVGELGIRGEAFGLVKSWPFLEGEYWFVNADEKSSAAAAQGFLGKIAAKSEPGVVDLTSGFSVPPREYLKQGFRKAAAGWTTTKAGVEEIYLRENVYTYTASGIAGQNSAGVMLVWVRDDPARSAENRCELMWQMHTGAGWSSPLAIADNGTGDNNPVVRALTNGWFVAAWQDQNTVHPVGIDVPDLARSAEITVSVYDPGGQTWDTEVLTSDDVYDATPMLTAATNGTAMVAWQRNAYTNIMGSASEPNEIMYSLYEGAVWSLPQTVASGLGMLMGSDLAWNGNEATLVYALDADSDYETVDDQEIYCCVYSNGTWSAPARATDNVCEDSNPQVVYNSAGAEICWLENGVFRTESGYPFGTNATVARGFDIIGSVDGGRALVWSDGDIQTAFHDGLAGCWNLPVPQADTENVLEKRLAGCFSTNGSLLISHNRDVMTTDTNGYRDVSQVDLAVIEVAPAPDAAITAISLSDAAPAPGSTVLVSVAVYNQGELACSNLLVTVYAGDPAGSGTLIGSANVVGWFLGGAETNLSVSWEVPTETVTPQIHAVVETAGVRADRDETNNELVQEVLGVDFSMDALGVSDGFEDSVILSATVQNTGSLSYTNGVGVSFCVNSPSGAVIGVDTVYPATSGSEYDASVEWDLSAETFTSAFQVVCAVVDPASAIPELDETDNVGLMLVMTTLDTDSDGLLDGEELQYGTRIDLPDTDGDGLTDADEIRIHGTGPTIFDTDGDGSGDGHEIAAGTDPFSATDVFKIVSTEGATNYLMCVRWNAKSGTTYRVEMVGSLMAGAWTNAPSGAEPEQQSEQTAVSNGVLRYYDMTPTTPTNRFYRVRIAP